MHKNVLLVGVGLLIGCGAGVAYRSAGPEAFAASPAGPRWDQLCYDGIADSAVSDIVRKTGAEGRELISVTRIGTGGDMLLCFKRTAP